MIPTEKLDILPADLDLYKCRQHIGPRLSS
jgi:hypothetical protein